MSNWEYSDDSCPKCGSQLATRRCDEMSCEGGYVEDDDPEWPSHDRCDACNGTGHQTWCRECGWDVTYSQFLSPQYEAEWKAKQPMITCPRCEGRREGFSFVSTTSGCKTMMMECHTCKGAGEISEEHGERLKAGDAIRKDRVNRRVSLREEAERLGLKPSQLGDIEHGRATFEDFGVEVET